MWTAPPLPTKARELLGHRLSQAQLELSTVAAGVKEFTPHVQASRVLVLHYEQLLT